MTPRAITSGRVKCPGFGSNTNGFHITFANGWTASVQFGAGNYCGNRDWSPNADPAGGFGRKAPKCHDAEVAAWFGDEDIADANLIGWQSPAQVGG